MDKYRIAVASADGVYVNMHFGKATCFYIYEVETGIGFRFCEKREMIPICKNGIHDAERMDINLNALSDCEYILSLKMGPPAVNKANLLGIKCMEAFGEAEEIIEEIIKDR